ncbi:hypothetical protein IFM89_003616 [Coptis chinensis]|uniref:Uncharacterized protein n=1 Tax=Coptis chinensis TaxID=261450 RepID=A0A835H318_9MAGN|nr:hypothetical protein IFM89_003616 [Coptis chinensis]
MFTTKNAFDVLLWKKHEGDGKTLQPWQSMVSGFLAGTASPVCTGPFDVVKTRLMAQSGSGSDAKYKRMVHAIRTIFAEEGLFALWKGLLPRHMRIPPGQAIMWGVVDQVAINSEAIMPLFPMDHTSFWIISVHAYPSSGGKQCGGALLQYSCNE